MTKSEAALYSRYVIDGVQQELTPAEFLYDLCPSQADGDMQCVSEIIDESAEQNVRCFDIPEPDGLKAMLPLVENAPKSFPLAYPESYTKSRIACALIDKIWRKGSFRLGNLSLCLHWAWNSSHVGAMAAFYKSVQAGSEYIDALGLTLDNFSYKIDKKAPSLKVGCELLGSNEEDVEPMIDEPYKLSIAEMSVRRAVPSKLACDMKSWVLFIPFESAEPQIGGSLFARTLGLVGAEPQIGDADYFIDCFELVREFVEDGVLLSATTVSEGGVLVAAQSMCDEELGLDINLSNLLQETQNVAAALYAELPGVLIQIRDSDFDYVDAELLLQDVAYFPLGHPNARGGLNIDSSSKTGLQTILSSLMQYAEGED